MLRNTSFTSMKNESDRDSNVSEDLLTDLHSHVLPGIDDGSVDPTESLRMLKLSRVKGVGLMIATPHFYPYLTTPERFFEKREASVEALLSAVEKEREQGAFFPRVGLGAEVAFFKGMSRSSVLQSFCIEGTRLLLIEMPFEYWGEAIIDELFGIKTALGLVPVIAHIDRYIQYQDRDSLASVLITGDILIQANASAFESVKSAKKVLGMLKAGEIDFLGSDCHNLTDRSPDMSRAVSIIEKKLGRKAIDELKRFGNYTLSEAVTVI